MLPAFARPCSVCRCSHRPAAHPDLVARALQLLEALVLGAAHHALVVLGVRVAGANHEPAEQAQCQATAALLCSEGLLLTCALCTAMLASSLRRTLFFASCCKAAANTACLMLWCKDIISCGVSRQQQITKHAQAQLEPGSAQPPRCPAQHAPAGPLLLLPFLIGGRRRGLLLLLGRLILLVLAV